MSSEVVDADVILLRPTVPVQKNATAGDGFGRNVYIPFCTNQSK